MGGLEFETLVLHAEDNHKRRLAALTICENAYNLEDAKELLKAVGLIHDSEAKPVHHVVKLGAVSTRALRRGRGRATEKTGDES